ncbi:MAG: putative toxin-antitoxin system toxin component, PIN family [Ignavibacteriae bacterium]|nr:putative toxin-antitoxin system toxin component, PIN family [Ignavibacteriota bacterium]NOG97945.1 putative toxin-antitoxin system toxin component, PIN family [Ignavibacteriota bacterium]
MRFVIDANIIGSASKSKNGFSFKLLSMIDDKRFQVFISVPLILEYEDAVKRNSSDIKLSSTEIDDVLDYICLIGNQRKIFYLWRPFLKDSKDDMVLEIAVESNSDFIISFNKKDFKGIEKFNLEVITPKEFLKKIGEKI